MRERWDPGGERRLRAGALPRRPPLFTRAARCVSLLCGLRRRGGSGVPSRVLGGGRRDLVTGGVGVRARRNGNFAGSAGAGPGGRACPSIVPAALAGGLEASSCPARCDAPRGSWRGPGLPSSAPGPQPRARAADPRQAAWSPELGGGGAAAPGGGDLAWGSSGLPVPGPRRPGQQVPLRRAGLPALGLRALPRDAPLPSPKVVPRTPELGSGKATKCAETGSRPCEWGLVPLPLSSVFIFCVLFPCKERSSCSPWPSC